MSEPMLPGEARFWDLAEPLLGQPGVTRSTMMGLPCLRWNGAFFASCDRRTGDLLVKLAETRVDELVATGRAQPFAPAGRRFREWAAIPNTDRGAGSACSTKPSSSRPTTRPSPGRSGNGDSFTGSDGAQPVGTRGLLSVW